MINGRKDLFIAAGSDAHGDFSYTRYRTPLVIRERENAFGKVRTVVYAPGYSQSNVPPQSEILNALRDGHSIMTDGPLITFTVYDYTTGVEEIIGNTLTVGFNTNLGIDIRGVSTPEFGSTINYEVWFGATVPGGTEEIVDSGSFDASPPGGLG